ncbi:hypothetical protein HOLleu_08202 [Holothuria leucospilota]|uniref:Uncharacterized protein n=1 Tax=Holothuria leucospilota TaxID=206669 RepID=A0A9Q1HHN8_HOLLE|nr:hypothetical protein HOLleu_08202 [Holothuria leucospilota]
MKGVDALLVPTPNNFLKYDSVSSFVELYSNSLNVDLQLLKAEMAIAGQIVDGHQNIQELSTQQNTDHWLFRCRKINSIFKFAQPPENNPISFDIASIFSYMREEFLCDEVRQKLSKKYHGESTPF